MSPPNGSFVVPISCSQLSPDNCLPPADFGVFWQLQETGSSPCKGETGRIRKPPFFPLNYEDSAIFDFRLPIANASRIELFVWPRINRPPGLRASLPA